MGKGKNTKNTDFDIFDLIDRIGKSAGKQVEEIIEKAEKKFDRQFSGGEHTKSAPARKPDEKCPADAHKWRPAAVKNQTCPARHCGACDTTEELSVEDFYTHFGQHFPVFLRQRQFMSPR